MKIYLVKRKKTNVRWFDNEDDLTKFLIDAPDRLDIYQITTINAEIESEIPGDKLYASIKDQAELDMKINVSLGDEYAQRVQNFIEAYKKWCPKTPWDNTKMTLEGLKVYEKLITTSSEEKKFTKAISSCYEYLVYTIGSRYKDSSEWFKHLLEVYPIMFTYKLKETCRVEYVDPVTRGTRWNGGRTPIAIGKSIEKAKKLLIKKN